MGGTVFKLIGLWLEAGAEDRQDDLAANDAAQNAQRQRWSAADARARGDAEAQQVALAGGQLEGRQRVAAANAGVVTNSGTAAQVQAQTSALTRLDAAQVQNNAMREAWGHEQVASNYDAQRTAHMDAKRNRGTKTFLTSLGMVVGDLGSSMGSMSGSQASSMFGGGGGGG